VRVDAEAIREAVLELRARTPVEQWSGLIHQDIRDGLNALAEQLVAEHGLDAVLRSLAPRRSDDNVAELLFHVFWSNEQNILPVFSEGEIVDAALRFLTPFRTGASEVIDERELPGWGWHAIWQHDYVRPAYLANEQHFRIFLALVDRLPLDDRVLWMIGNGPLAHARESPDYGQRIEALAETNSKIARAIQLARK
jgi:hypothetical protein